MSAGQRSEGERSNVVLRVPLPASLAPAATSTNIDHVVQQLRSAILDGSLPPGTRLVEIELASGLGVSRGPIREALVRLQSLGLVTLRPNRGAVVRSLSGEDVLEVYILRSALAVVAIRQLIGANLVDSAAENLIKLERIGRRQMSRRSQERMIDSDLAFQSAVVNACGLRRVSARFEELTAEVRLFILTSGIVYPDADRIIQSHSDLLSAILNRDTEAAVALWRSRMRVAVEEFLSLIPDGADIVAERPWVWDVL